MRYEPLSLVTRKQVWESFLKKAVTAKGAAEYKSENLDGLARKNRNGRQVRDPLLNPAESFKLTEPSIVEQKHGRRGSCVSCVSHHHGVYVSYGIGHKFERGI